MLWLCQITFAGVGALTTAQLANNHGWPVLLAVVAGGVVALVMGIVVGLLSIRLGDLYVALVTLTFGLLMENLVFTLPSFVNQGLGLTLNRPGFASSDRAFAYLCLAVFVVIALFIVNFRRSTTGLALNAAALERVGRQDIGHQRRADEGHRGCTRSGHRRHRGRDVRPVPDDLPAERVRDVRGRRMARRVGDDRRPLECGRPARRCLARSPPAITQNYLPTWTSNVTPVLFGLGAVSAAKYPDGVLAEQSRRLRRLVLHVRPQPEDAESRRPGSCLRRRGTGPDESRRGAHLVTFAPSETQAPDAFAGAGEPALSAHDITVRFGGLAALSGGESRGPPGEHRRAGRAERCREIDAPRRPVRSPAAQRGPGASAR